MIASSKALQANSETRLRLSTQGELEIVGAEYSFRTGKVDFFERAARCPSPRRSMAELSLHES